MKKEKKKVLITVKTYPTLSAKYDELVCTAGFLEDGTWIRTYPIQFRKLDYNKQYKKYEWIEIDLEKNSRDFRKESYRPVSLETKPTIINKVDTVNYWHERKKIVLKNPPYTNKSKLLSDLKEKQISLAVFKPSKVLDFTYEEVDREWDETKLQQMNQMRLFEETKGKFNIVRKLPYKFKYRFEDDEGVQSYLMIEDWEVGVLYWKMFDKYNDEKIACEKVKEKYFEVFVKSGKYDLHFFLGTMLSTHNKARNPFIIIGAFYPMIQRQMTLDFDKGK